MYILYNCIYCIIVYKNTTNKIIGMENVLQVNYNLNRCSIETHCIYEQGGKYDLYFFFYFFYI